MRLIWFKYQSKSFQIERTSCNLYSLAGVEFLLKGGRLVRGIYSIILIPCEFKKKKWIFQGVRTPPPTPSLDPRMCKPKKFRLLYQGFHLHIYEYRTLQKNTWVYTCTMVSTFIACMNIKESVLLFISKYFNFVLNYSCRVSKRTQVIMILWMSMLNRRNTQFFNVWTLLQLYEY